MLQSWLQHNVSYGYNTTQSRRPRTVQPGKPLGVLVWKKNLCTICHLGSIQLGQCTPQSGTMQQMVAPAPCPERTQSAAKGRFNIKSDCYQTCLYGSSVEWENKEAVSTGFRKGKARRRKPFYKWQEEKGKTSFKAPWVWHSATEKGTIMEWSPGLDPASTLQALLLTVWSLRLIPLLTFLSSPSCLSDRTILL